MLSSLHVHHRKHHGKASTILFVVCCGLHFHHLHTLRFSHFLRNYCLSKYLTTSILIFSPLLCSYFFCQIVSSYILSFTVLISLLSYISFYAVLIFLVSYIVIFSSTRLVYSVSNNKYFQWLYFSSISDNCLYFSWKIPNICSVFFHVKYLIFAVLVFPVSNI